MVRPVAQWRLADGVAGARSVEAEGGGGVGEEGQNGSCPLRVGSPGRVPEVSHQDQAIDAQVLVATDQILVYRFGRGDTYLDPGPVSRPVQGLKIPSDSLQSFSSGGQSCREAVPAISLEHSSSICGRRVTADVDWRT